MVAVRCPNCQIMAEVEEGQEGSLVRCPECGGMMRVPLVEKSEAYGAGADKAEATRPKAVKDYVKNLEKEARRKARDVKKGYQRQSRPVGVIVGWTCVATGALFLLIAMLNFGAAPMSSLIRGILPAIVFFLIGAMCLLVR